MSKQSSAGEQRVSPVADLGSDLDYQWPSKLEQRGETGQPKPWTCDVCMTCDPKHCKCELKPEAQPLPGGTDEMRKMMDATIPFAELFERSKDDRAIIVGSEVREVIGAYRRCLSKLGDLEAQLSQLKPVESVEGAWKRGQEDMQDRINESLSRYDVPYMGLKPIPYVAPTLSTVQDREEK